MDRGFQVELLRDVDGAMLVLSVYVVALLETFLTIGRSCCRVSLVYFYGTSYSFDELCAYCLPLPELVGDWATMVGFRYPILVVDFPVSFSLAVRGKTRKRIVCMPW
jgi:hypothetical protein